MEYGALCEKLIAHLEQQLEWIIPASGVRGPSINPNPYHHDVNMSKEQ